MNKDSLKAKAKNVAQKYNLDSRYIIQYVMFESLIRRISISKYKENIIIKGGFLLSSIFVLSFLLSKIIPIIINKTKTIIPTIIHNFLFFIIHLFFQYNHLSF